MSDLEQQLRHLGKEKFESLIHQLLDAKYPGASIKRVEGAGGDEGIDSFQGTLSNGPAVWQDKHFPDRIRKTQKKQILESVKVAFSNRNLALWTLCVPIDLRTEEHDWFQSEIEGEYGGPEKIKLMQASDILKELIHNRPLRDAFFPDNSISNVLRLRQIAMKTEDLTTEETGTLAAEYAHQYLEGKTDLEPRLKAVMSVGPDLPIRQTNAQGLVWSFNEGDKTTHYFARNVSEYNLDPIKFGITTRGEPPSGLQEAIDTGVPFSLAAGDITQIDTSSPLIRSLFEGKDPAAFRLELQPVLPSELATKELPLRLIAGSGSTAKEIPYLPFRVVTLGRREMTMVSGGLMPIQVTLKLRPEERAVSVSIRPKMQGAEIRSLHHVLQFLDELERSGEFEVFSLESSAPLAKVTENLKSGLSISAGLKAIIADAATVAAVFGTKLCLPEKILEKDVENLSLLKRIATGEEFFDVDVIGTLRKQAADQDRVLAALDGSPLPLRFEPQRSSGALTVFNQEVDPGPVVFEAEAASFKSPDKTRKTYLAASEGENVDWTMRCAGPCRLIWGKNKTSKRLAIEATLSADNSLPGNVGTDETST
jgi:hypothetical protein